MNPARRLFHDWLSAVCLGLVLWVYGAATAFGADTLSWNTNQNRVSADITSSPLLPTLEQIAIRTGWHVFVEPGITHEVSAKFSDTNPGQALRLLLGDVNFALVPETNASPRLYVFRSTRQQATQAVQLAPDRPAAKSRIIPNELIVRLKPGAKIDDIARLLGAKVIGRIDSLNAYRLRFDDQAAADSARTELASNSDVQSVDNNYTVDRPVTPSALMGGNLPPPPQLQLRPPPETGRVIVGLVDTGVQPLGNDLDKFLLKAISLAGDAQLDPNSPSHGTSMAETILRSLQAVTQGSTSVQILPVDVYGGSASSSTFEVASGIATAVNGGARIINLSLGSDGDSSILRDIVQQALDKNITIVSAAGNIPDTRNTYPAAYPGVDAVTAIDKGQLAPYANRGSFVSLGAPGTSIIYFNNQPYYVVGTSPASAYVSGLAAGYAERNKASSDQINTWLRSNLGVTIKSGN